MESNKCLLTKLNQKIIWIYISFLIRLKLRKVVEILLDMFIMTL